MDKKIITILFLISFSLSNVPFVYGNDGFANIYKGNIQKTDINRVDREKEPIFTGEVHTLEKNHELNMTVSQVLSGAYSKEGDEFFAEVTEDVKGANGTVLPVGTIAHGSIRNMEEAKSLGRGAWIEMDFDYLITPDGREIPINAKMISKDNPIVGGAKVIAQDVGFTAAGGIVGTMAALNIFGIEGAIASQGYTLAGGAALGGAVGLVASLVRKGKDVLLSPGDIIQVKLSTEIELPVISEESLKQDEINLEGLDVRFTNIKIEEDPFGNKNTYALSLSIVNSSGKHFSTFDVALMDDMNGLFYPSLFGDSNLNFTQINPGDRVAGKICFSVNNVKHKHWLVFLDRRKRKPLAKISIDNAIRTLDKEAVNKKRKKKRHKVS